MKRFQFPLDRVLRYRQIQAEAEEAKLQALLAKLAELDRGIAQFEAEGRRTEDAVRQSLAANREVVSGEMVSYPNYRFVLARGKRAMLEERRRRMNAVEQQQASALAAYRACEILARARTKARERWQSEYTKEMDALAGELFLNKWTPPRRKPTS